MLGGEVVYHALRGQAGVLGGAEGLLAILQARRVGGVIDQFVESGPRLR